MNTGIQAAWTLARNLAEVARGHAGRGLLDTYDEERVPIGRALLGSTRTVTFLVQFKNLLATAALPVVFTVVGNVPPLRRAIQRKVLGAMSGLRTPSDRRDMGGPRRPPGGGSPGFLVRLSSGPGQGVEHRHRTGGPAMTTATQPKPVAPVTGGTSGIGLAVARELGQRGHRVFLCARTEEVEQTVEDLRAEALEVEGAAADVRSADSLAALVRTAVDTFGPITVLVNNAGRSGGGPTAGISDELWHDVIDTNLTRVFLFTREVLNHGGITGDPSGRIINIASTAGKQGVVLGAPCTASKHAVVGRQGYAAAYGTTTEQVQEQFEAKIPLGRYPPRRRSRASSAI